MKQYEASGSDSTSDNGYWVGIVTASSVQAAKNKVLKHLRTLDRDDLTKKHFTVTEICYEDGILHSTVQLLPLERSG